SLQLKGKPIANTEQNRNRAVIGYLGSVMPPPEAVAGKYVGPEGEKIKGAPLSDEDKRTLASWVDLGCPIDHEYDPKKPDERGVGWMLDDNRPTLTLTYPRTGANEELSRLVVGMHDYDSGLDLPSFKVVADFAVDGNKPGKDLASLFEARGQGVWQLRL